MRMYHSTHDFEPLWYEEGVPGSLLPIDMTAEQSLPAELELKRRLRVCRHARDIDRTLDHNIKIVAHYFVRQSRVSRVLETGIQVGYQTRDGAIERTDIMLLSDLT
jgi:hypothetical protein